MDGQGIVNDIRLPVVAAITFFGEGRFRERTAWFSFCYRQRREKDRDLFVRVFVRYIPGLSGIRIEVYKRRLFGRPDGDAGGGCFCVMTWLSRFFMWGYCRFLTAILTVVIMFALGGCKSVGCAFSAEELQTIHAGGADGIMRLCTVNDRDDSLLLRSKSAFVSEEMFASPDFAVLVKRMLATVRNPENEGVGIAAPQVGILRRIIAVQRFDKEGEPFEIYINPEITFYSGNKLSGPEGCLSVPGLRGLVERSTDITVRYRDGASFEERCENVSGFTAVIFQHEIDHLSGRLYIDIASDIESKR